jgi:hypothetical protein
VSEADLAARVAAPWWCLAWLLTGGRFGRPLWRARATRRSHPTPAPERRARTLNVPESFEGAMRDLSLRCWSDGGRTIDVVNLRWSDGQMVLPCRHCGTEVMVADEYQERVCESCREGAALFEALRRRW